MMDTLEEEIKFYIELNTQDKIKEFYYDWNLEEKSGMLLYVFENDQPYKFEPYENKDLIEEETIQFSKEIQKAPEKTDSTLLNDRTMIIARHGILISLEKEFIQLGFQETLKTAKRNLEKRIIHDHKDSYEEYLNATITDYFVDWNFGQDKSYYFHTETLTPIALINFSQDVMIYLG